MTAGPDLWTATPEHAARVGALVAEAFHDDPITEWVVPVEGDRRTVLPGYFGAAGAAAVAHGAVHVVGDFEAVAVWFDVTTPAPAPPEQPDDDLRALCGPYARNFATLETAMHRAAPPRPHHHLAFLAVRAGLRGAGLGSRLLEHHHRHLARVGVDAYLDASNGDSRRLYLRHGYRDHVGPFHPGGEQGPPMWPMVLPFGG